MESEKGNKEEVKLKPIDSEKDFRDIEALHLIKYNLYLACKSIVFHAVVSRCQGIDEAVGMTNKVIGELDLEFKSKHDKE